MRWKTTGGTTTDSEQWHRWFAWRPVRITGTDTVAWLEFVERRVQYALVVDCLWNEYRLIDTVTSAAPSKSP